VLQFTYCTVFHANSCKTLTYQHSVIQNVMKNISDHIEIFLIHTYQRKQTI